MGAEAASDPSAAFIFVTCQVGAQGALKNELAREWPALRLAFSRPGFLTFKLPAGQHVPDDFELPSVFARAYGLVLGKVAGGSTDELAAQAWALAGDRPFEALHVWQRDLAAVGFRGFEPHVTPAAQAAEEAIIRLGRDNSGDRLPRVAQPGQLVLDCVLVEPDQWWVGCHRAAGESCFPGGVREIAPPAEMISRAYIKMQEALAWSALPTEPGQVAAEIGCAPGGASQALLDQGLKVIGIDPARVDEQLLANPDFTHIQKRGSEVRRREFRGVTWLAADVNVAPAYTLDTVEAIVTHPEVKIRGLLLTLKLLDWNLADEVPDYLERIRGWGYGHVRARQLPHNRQEICVTAQRRKRARGKR